MTTEKLTGRQLEILGLVAKGCTNPEICRLLSISINTVKIHVAAVLRILGVANRTEAAFAYQELINADSSTELAGRAKAAQRVGCPAIAVVPFEERAPADDYFSEGLVEDLIMRLGSWRWFPIVAFASSRKFNLQQHTVAEIGAELNVGYIITGGVRRVGQRARVNVSLLSVRDGATVWSQHFDHELTNIFAVQDEITRMIVARIAPELIATEARVSDSGSHISLDAWRHTARGFWHLAQRAHTHAVKARVAFEAAVDIDKEYALAWNGLAQCHYQMIFEQWTADRLATMQAFVLAVESCARCDPNGAGSHMLRGLAKMIAGDPAAAYAHLQQSVALNPSQGQALGLLGQMTIMRGATEEGIALLEDALRLNPHDTSTWIHAGALAMAYFTLDHFAEGIELAKRGIALKQESMFAHTVLIGCLQSSGQRAEEQVAVQELLRVNPKFRVAPFLGLLSAAPPQQVQRLRGALLAAGLPE